MGSGDYFSSVQTGDNLIWSTQPLVVGFYGPEAIGSSLRITESSISIESYVDISGSVAMGTNFGNTGYILASHGYSYEGWDYTGYISFMTQNGTSLGYIGNVPNINNSAVGPLLIYADASNGTSGIELTGNNITLNGNSNVTGTMNVTGGMNAASLGASYIETSTLQTTTLNTSTINGNNNELIFNGNTYLNEYLYLKGGGTFIAQPSSTGSACMAIGPDGNNCYIELGTTTSGVSLDATTYSNLYITGAYGSGPYLSIVPDSSLSANIGINIGSPSYPLHISYSNLQTDSLISQMYEVNSGYSISFGLNVYAGNYGNYVQTGDNIIVSGNSGLSSGGNLVIGCWNGQNIRFTNSTITSSTSISSLSDYRLKTNVKQIDDKFTVDKLKPVEFDIGQKHTMGFIAHEVQEEIPFLVDGEKDGENMQSLNYTGLIALLVKEIQDLKKEVKELKQKLNY
jgi:hypothetical protein